jgi:Putative Flp pilus-assembly TadE/G-like
MSERHLSRHPASQVPKRLKGHCLIRAWRGNERGNVAITFALCLIPTIGAVGVAVDYSRASALRADLQAAVDAAAIAGAQKLNESNRDVKKEVAAFVRSNIPPAYQKLPIDIEIGDDRKRLMVKMQGNIDAKFVQLFGIRKIEVGVMSEAAIGVDNTEVVLALDTTGTMRNHIPALQQGAQELLTILFNNARDKNALKVGLVPYVTAVNIGNHARRMDWMDSNAESRFHGENFENVRLPDRRREFRPRQFRRIVRQLGARRRWQREFTATATTLAADVA